MAFFSGKVQKFNAIWKTERPFPIDMAAFALHISLILKNPKAAFTYNVARGYQVCFCSNFKVLRFTLNSLEDSENLYHFKEEYDF